MDNRKTETIASVATVWALAVLAVALRLMSQRISAARYGMEDVLIVVALVSDQLGICLKTNIGVSSTTLLTGSQVLLFGIGMEYDVWYAIDFEKWI